MNTPLPELSRDPFITTEQTENVIATTLEYLSRKVSMRTWMLDVGRVSPLTLEVKEKFELQIVNTHGDLDNIDLSYNSPFDYILYSHTIEHQFNPLHTLIELKKVMHSQTKMFIILPSKPKFLWWEGHFHEIDHYRMTLLLKRAGLTVISYERHRVFRHWTFYLTGLRPMLRLFLEYNDYYEVKL